MRRRASSSIAANPLLLGGFAVLLVCFGLYVAVRSTRGLPFVPTYTLNVQVPDAAQVVRGSDVTIAGKRVGQVSRVTAIDGRDGSPVAVLQLGIEQGRGPLPVDSTYSIRLAGSLGRKAVAITPGRSRADLPDGADVPVSQFRVPVVDVDQVLDAFDTRTRAGAGSSVETFGLGLAGRGEGLNLALGRFPALLSDLRPVARNLSRPSTGLGRYVRSLRAFFAQLEPVADRLPAFFADGATAFAAFASVSRELEATIDDSPETLDVATASLRRTRPFLTAATGLARDLRPGVATLRQTAPVLADALAAGTSNLPLVPATSARVARAVDSVAAFAGAPAVRPGLARISETAGALRPPLAFLTPAETTCSYFSLLLRNVASLFEEGHATGTSARATAVVIGVDRNAERGPSRTIFPGPVAKALGPVHSNPYPNTASPGQPRECEAGNEPYIQSRAVIGNVPGVQDSGTEATRLP